MKRVFATLVLGIAALTAFAQNEPDEQMKQQFFDAKIREIAYHLQLTDQQKADFTPIYQKYSDEMHEVVGRPEKPTERPANADEAVAHIKSRLEHQQKALSVRLKYVDEFAKILEPRQLNKLYDVEDQIQKKLRDRKDHGRPEGEPRQDGQRGRHGQKPDGQQGPRGER